MDLYFLLGLLTCTLRNWNPRPACGTAVKSVRISMSVWPLKSQGSNQIALILLLVLAGNRIALILLLALAGERSAFLKSPLNEDTSSLL